MVLVSEKKIRSKVEEAIEQIRPFLNDDGGDMELVEVLSNKDIKIRFLGSCKTCNMKEITFNGGVEEIIRKVAPEVNKIIQIE